MKKHIIIIIGPSGGGKTTLGEFLKSLGWSEFVSHTTRKPRKNEKHGVSYYFTNRETFIIIKKIEKGAEYPKDSGEFYALSEEEVASKVGVTNCYCVLEIEGALNIKNLYPDAKIVFVYNDVDVLRQRMIDRGDSLEKIQKRIDNITESNEMDNMKYADFVIKNEDFKDTEQVLLNYINNL